MVEDLEFIARSLGVRAQRRAYGSGLRFEVLGLSVKRFGCRVAPERAGNQGDSPKLNDVNPNDNKTQRFAP